MAEKKITEEELKKSIEELAPVKEDEKKEEVVKEVVVTPIMKKAEETLKEKASIPLQKSLEVSNVLAEFAGVMGLHVDACIETINKSLDQAGQRDLAFLKVMQKFGEKLDELGAKVDKFGEKPLPAQTKIVSKDGEVLEKSAAEKPKSPAKTPADARKLILKTLEKKALEQKPNSSEFGKYQRATTKFESTGVIDDEMLAEVVEATGIQIAA